MFMWFTGLWGSLVRVVHWFVRFTGSCGSLVRVVHWFVRFTGSWGSLVGSPTEWGSWSRWLCLCAGSCPSCVGSWKLIVLARHPDTSVTTLTTHLRTSNRPHQGLAIVLGQLSPHTIRWGGSAHPVWSMDARDRLGWESGSYPTEPKGWCWWTAPRLCRGLGAWEWGLRIIINETQWKL